MVGGVVEAVLSRFCTHMFIIGDGKVQYWHIIGLHLGWESVRFRVSLMQGKFDGIGANKWCSPLEFATAICGWNFGLLGECGMRLRIVSAVLKF